MSLMKQVHKVQKHFLQMPSIQPCFITALKRSKRSYRILQIKSKLAHINARRKWNILRFRINQVRPVIVLRKKKKNAENVWQKYFSIITFAYAWNNFWITFFSQSSWKARGCPDSFRLPSFKFKAEKNLCTQFSLWCSDGKNPFINELDNLQNGVTDEWPVSIMSCSILIHQLVFVLLSWI